MDESMRSENERRAILHEARQLAAPWFQRGFKFAGANTCASEPSLRLRHGETGEEVTLLLVEGELVEQRGTPSLLEPGIRVPFRPHTSPDVRSDKPAVRESPSATDGPIAANSKPAKTIGDAVDFLREFLGDTEHLGREAREAGELAGFGWRSIQAASTRLGVARRKAGMRGGWAWKLPSQERLPNAHEDAKAKVHEGTAAGRESSADAEDEGAAESVCETVRETAQSAQKSPDASAVAGTVAITAGAGVQQGVQTRPEGSRENRDAFAAEVAEALRSEPDAPYDIRARRCGDSRYRIAVAARTEGGEVESTTFEVLCESSVVQAAFRRVGDSERTTFVQRVDNLTRLLGRTQALAHATTDVVIEVAQGPVPT